MVEVDTLSDRLAPMTKVTPFPPGGRMLLRSRSFNMLRQFPAYLCRGGASTDIVHWLYDSRTKLSTSFSLFQKQAQHGLWVLSIWSCLLVLGVEASWVGVSLASGAKLPLGLGFMVSCVIIMATMAARVIWPTNTKTFHR